MKPRRSWHASPPLGRRMAHHAAVEVLLHLAEGVRWRLPLARDDDADVGDGQRVLRLHGRCSAEGDEDALRIG